MTLGVILLCLAVAALLADHLALYVRVTRLERRLAEMKAFDPWRGEEKEPDEPEPPAYSYFPETMPDVRKHPPGTAGAEEFYVEEQFGRIGVREYLEEMTNRSREGK